MLFHKKKINILKSRAKIISEIRAFFWDNNFTEVETPILTASPMPEKFIDAINCNNSFLVTSPEIYMKQLLANGFDKIFQISKSFRHREIGKIHNPEFTMLEWYSINSNYLNLIDDTKKLLNFIAEKINKPNIFKNWEIFKLDDLWLKITGEKLTDMPDDFYFDNTLVQKIEPALPKNKIVVLLDYPSTFSPMAKTKKNNPFRAERFEIYFNGIELANGCSEQTDFNIQTARIKEERTAREKLGKNPYPFPIKFLDSIKSLPPSAGMALGIDRLVMILCGADKISDVISFIE